MDTKIRQLLQTANKIGGQNGCACLDQAFGLIKNFAEARTAVDNPDAFNQDLYVLCAETAFQYGKADICRECLKFYFMKTPPTNQFLCRAYLCQAQLLAPTTADNPEQLEKAVVYLVKAINIAKENQRCHFLVYNASVIYWQFSRPFLKPRFKQYLAPSLHQVVKALDDIDDADCEWRAQLMIALIECHVDAGSKTDAMNIATTAATFIKQNVPVLYKTVFALMVRHQLVETAKLQKEVKASIELKIFYSICLIRQGLDQQEPDRDFAEEMRNVLLMIQNPEEAANKDFLVPEDRPNIFLLVGSCHRTAQRHKTPVKRTKPEVQEKDTLSSLKGKSMGVHLSVPYLLLELGRLAVEQNLPDIADQCLVIIEEKSSTVEDASFFLEVEFLKCDVMVRSLGEKQEAYTKNAVHIRQQAIKRCEEAIQNAVRQRNPNIIQAGCVTLWNLCLPLLQANLRQHVRRPLTTVAEALESINSLLVQLRCQIHMELAKCEEDQEQIAVAMAHLKKALILDDGQMYQERIQVALHRMELRAELYNQPERPEDQAGMIIEQARKADSGTIRMKRSLLVRAGQALAPDAFQLVLESESETKEYILLEITGGGKKPQTLITRFAGKARQFKKGVKKAAGHLRRLGNENDRERARLWADLTKTARKQEVWDVCRVAARFFLLYDDDRWKMEEAPVQEETPVAKKESENVKKDMSQKSLTNLQKEVKEPSPPPSPEPQVALSDKDLIRTMAEVHFINGEALIHLLRSEGVELGDKPIPPEDKSKRPKGYVAVKPEEDPEWLEYCEWITSLSSDAVSSFIRATSLGVQLREPWICCCAATYMWNYNNHMLDQGRHPEIVEGLTAVLEGLKTVGHAGESSLLTNICNAIAIGLAQPWLPDTSRADAASPTNAAPRTESPKKKGAPPPTTTAAAKKSVTISSDATPNLKKALEICEYGLQITNGNNPLDVVPIAVRYPLLQTWVSVKQMLQSQIGKGLGTDEESGEDVGQNAMTRAMVATEMLSLNKNGIMEFKDLPSIAQTISMVEKCQWTDRLIELQLWTKLTSLCHEAKDHRLMQQCAVKALAFAEAGSQTKMKQAEGHRYIVEQEMLSYASCLYGQSLAELCQGKNSVRRQAMEQFLFSAKFACNAKNKDLVMAAARHYWNTALPLINIALERELLMNPLTVLLECISLTSDKVVPGKEKCEQDEDKFKEPKLSSVSVNQEAESKTSQGDIAMEDDLSLRAAIYGVLFQAYADKGEWEAGLKAMDQAIADMPRTSHRLQIFKHMVIVRAKLGLNVQMSIQKFKDESDHYVAHMWRRVALCSKDQMEQLQAYQNAIEALSKPESDWQKIDYLIEFGQWLYCNNFPLEDALDQIEWACDILLNMKFETEQKAETEEQSKDEAVLEEDKTKKSSKKGKGSATTTRKLEKNQAGESENKVTITTEVEQKPDVQKSEAEEGDFVPIRKDVLIGVLPTNPGLSISDLTDVRQLDNLFQAATIQAEICGRGSTDHLGHCLMAFGYIMRIWQISLGNCGSVAKEQGKNPTQHEAPAGKTSAKGKKKEKEKKEKVAVPPPKEKPKRKGPVDAIPANIEEWASYDAPDEVLDAFKHESMATSGINANTITKPAMTLHYLNALTKLLRDNGYNHLVLPLLALGDVLSRDLLKSRLLGALVHLRSMEVCLELNLLEGAMFHENLTELNIDVSDQTKSREEITLWKEKQAQVAKEEVRLHQSMSRLSKRLSGKKIQLSPRDKGSTGKMSGDGAVTHLGIQVGAVNMREIWTDMAEIFLRHALYQPAREMLSEAHKAAEAFDDKPLLARILFLLGKLAFHEGQFRQASNFGHLAQETYEGDERFWYETTMLIVDATECNYLMRNQCKKAKDVLVTALKVFQEVALHRPNKVSITGFIIARMEAKVGLLEIKIAKEKMDLISKAKFVSGILSSCKKIRRSEEQLVKLGYGREAVSLYKERIHILNMLAREADTMQEKHDFYLQCVKLFKEVQILADGITYDIQTSSPISELNNISLPVQRESAEIKLLCSELMLEIFHLMTCEDRMKHLAALRKGSLLRAVEELSQQTVDYSSAEKEWMTTKDVLGDVILTLLSNVHSQVGSLPNLKARSLYNIGHCLSLLSEGINPDQPAEWSLNEIGMSVTMDQGNTEEDEEVTKTVTERQDTRYRLTIAKNVKNLQSSFQYLMQATECLTQAINLALSKGNAKLTSMAALQLVECLGQYDPGLSSQYLALHQSCEASLYLEDLMKVALIDPTKSQQASLIYQKANLLKTDVTTNASAGPVLRHVEVSLQQLSQAWKRIKVSANHLDILKDFPPNFVFIVIQHSPDKNHLYGAVLDRPKNASTQAVSKGGKGNVVQALSKAKVVRYNTDPDQLETLLSRFRSFKKDNAQKVLTEEYQRSQQAQKAKMLASLDQAQSSQAPQIAVNDFGAEYEEIRLQQEFIDLLSAMEDYLSPVTQMLKSALRPSSETPSHEKTDKKGETHAPEQMQDFLVLLVDPCLMELPLEALAALQGEHIVSVSREISLQMLHHKWHTEAPAEETVDKAKKDKEKTKPPSRIPGMRDASKRQSKIIPLDRPVPQGYMPVETHAFKYIVDPHLDCSETEEKKPIEIFDAVLEEHSMQFTPRWLGVAGNDHTPSAGEYEIYMQESSAFIFYGMERLLCFLPPYKIASMNLLDCNMVMLFDRMQTNKSFLRQSKIDILKTTDMLKLEQPIETAMLLSLTGVRSVMANQWNCSLAENAEKVQTSFKDLLANGIPNGQAVRHLHLPERRKKEDTEEAETAAEDGAPEKNEDEGEPPQSSSLPVSRDFFNMVCYGLPNLIVTQLTKL